MSDPKTQAQQRPKRRVRRYSPDGLLRQPVALSGGVILSAEKHRGRIVARTESASDER